MPSGSERWIRSLGAALLAGFLLLASASVASALSLFDLEQPGSFVDSLDGKLRFENFSTNGQLSDVPLDDNDLMNLEVIALDDGFRLIGSIGVANGFDGDIVLSYTVSTPMGGLVDKAKAFFNGSALGIGAIADVTETFSLPPDAPPDVLLGTLQLTAVGTPELPDTLMDMTMFSEAVPSFLVLKDILVSARSETAVSATISVIDQRYEMVPEPSTALMLGGALALFGLGTRRRA